MSHRKLLFFFVSLSIASPIDQYFQHYPAPSLGGTGIDPGTLDLQSSWNNPSLVAAAVPDTLNPVPSFDQSSLLSQTWGDPLFDSPPPQGYHGRGPPVPIDPNLGFSDFGRYPGYPSANTPDLLDPETGNTQYYAQPRRGCKDPNKKLYCCRPILIMCRECELIWSSQSWRGGKGKTDKLI